MPDVPASAQEVRAVLAKWTAHDWRRAFGLVPELEGSIRRTCEIPPHKPLTNNTGALALPVLKRLGELDRQELVQALAPLAQWLEIRLTQAAGETSAAVDALRGQADVGPGLASLAGCRLGMGQSVPDPAPAATPRELTGAVAAIEQQQPALIAGIRRILDDAEAGRPARLTDLALVRDWNEALARGASLAGSASRTISLESLRATATGQAQEASAAETAAELAGVLRAVTEASLTGGARAVLAEVLHEAAHTTPTAVEPERREVFLAVHRLLSQNSWEVDDADVTLVEQAFGRQVARVAVAERAIGAGPPTTG